MAEQEKDRTEPATPFKLEEAKHRGQVSKSLDFISLVMLSAFLAALYAWADDLARFGLRLSVGALESGAELAFTPPVAATWLGKISLATLALVAPFLAAAVLAAVVANLVQTGAIFSAFPLKPDFQRLNPALGFKRLFSLKVLVETGKTILKLVLVFILIVLMDLAYSRWDYARQMMMSRRELKDEIKRREGDPHVRARIRELQREAAKRAKSLKRLPEA